MKPFGLARSALFVPGNRPERVDKAVATAADLVIIDLEDAVPVAEKAAVRPIVREKLDRHRDRRLMVRVNALDTGLTESDLTSIVGPGPDSILLPKVQTPEDVARMGRLMSAAEEGSGLQQGTLGLVALIETALGVRNVFNIADAKTEPPRLHTLAFGAADFSLDMGFRITKTGEELAFPRARIALACRAAGIDPPLDTPFMIDLKDREAFEADAMRGQRLGFGGKLCIHPDQVDFCNTLFSPTAEEIAFAAKVVAAFEEAEAKGLAAIQVDGRFIDYPVFAQSRRIVEIAEKMHGPKTR
ncbi:MAG: CoA ester lyase [Deltaproteobacteria bacterium HGW-Deltaproteobacteria-21]|nr:MAG: CoA ester lyase [Deltaproteobacteria bacterium HGW-Deltaproteobacteria-21]